MKDLRKIKMLEKSGGGKPTKVAAVQQKKVNKNDISGLDNPLFDQITKLKRKIPDWDTFFSEEARERRPEYWEILDSIGQDLCEKYAWAIPDDRSLNILKHFSPLIEIGSGKGYWSKLLQNRGVDVIGFDKFTGGNSKENFTKIKEGGPEKLLETVAQGRNLFLCYPDEAESIAIVCLENFTGEYIIHVGELMANTTGTMAGAPVAPYGRTSSAEFQITLAEQFHCLLICNLTLRYPYSKDCISVWKRTNYVAGKDFPGDHSSQQSGSDDEDEDESEEEEEVAPPPSKKSKANAPPSASDLKCTSKAMEYVDMDMLKKLRGETVDVKSAPKDTKKDSKKGKSHSEAPQLVAVEDDGQEYMDIATLNKLRGITAPASVKTSTASSKGPVLKTVSDGKASLQSKDDEYSEDSEDGSEGEEGEGDEGSEDGSGSYSGSEFSDPYAGLTDQQRAREMALDDQYNEDKDNGWCDIPADEILPVDRAAPCLAHLL